MIYMIGGAGNGNFGDELIVRGWLSFLREAGVTDPVVCDENYASISRRFIGTLFPDALFAEDVNRLKSRGADTFFAAFSRGWRFYENGGFERHPDLAQLQERLQKTKVLHMHGGGYINTIWPKNAFLLGFTAATKREYGCRLVGTGLGLLPAANPPELYLPILREAIETFDLLEVRDRWAFDWLRRISDAPCVVNGLDDSFLLPREAPQGTGPRTLHLSWFSFAQGFDEMMAYATGPEAKDFERILFWACTDQDMRCFEKLKESCPRAESTSWQELVKGPLPVRPGDVLLTARFHPHMLAARYGATGAYRVDRGYYDVKQGSIVDLGSPFRQIGAGPLSFPKGAATAYNPIYRLDEERVASKRKLASWIYRELLPAGKVAPDPEATRRPAPAEAAPAS